MSFLEYIYHIQHPSYVPLNNQESELTLFLVQPSTRRPYIRTTAAEIYDKETMQDLLDYWRDRVPSGRHFLVR